MQLRTDPRKVSYSPRVSSWMRLLWIVLAICVATQIPSAAAEPESYPVRIIPVPHPITSLLRAEVVRLELALSPFQIRRINEAVGEVDLPLWRLRDLPPAQRNEQAEPLIRGLEAGLSQILSARQLERLNQIARQAEGIGVVLKPEIVERLNLSTAQAGDIAAVLGASYEKLTTLQSNGEMLDDTRRAAYALKLRAKTERNVLTVLSGHQQRTVNMLMGLPFDLSRIRVTACKAPEFEAGIWLNSPALKMSDLSGKVTVIHFYAFGCGNCVRTLPFYNVWRRQFPAENFRIVGIHRPETQRERQIEEVREKAAEARMEYPIAIDNESLNWDAWANCVWPSIYLVDKNGFVRYWWYGELNWQGAESEKYIRGKIEQLLKEES
ncbi:MAG: redoxin domain-containing protein [Phycisphaerales bacterium]|nr:MAG: redoxin domain-containing protein [Phycisphaerales bacterium]